MPPTSRLEVIHKFASGGATIQIYGILSKGLCSVLAFRSATRYMVLHSCNLYLVSTLQSPPDQADPLRNPDTFSHVLTSSNPLTSLPYYVALVLDHLQVEADIPPPICKRPFVSVRFNSLYFN